MKHRPFVVVLLGALAACGESESTPTAPVDQTLLDGQQIFRFDTFGNETFWTDTLGMPAVVQTLSPTTALGPAGLKVDVDALPATLVSQLRAGQVDLNDPATTVALLKLGAVVGVQATVSATNTVTRLGITCAICHSTVDNSLTAGIGHRLDGWANGDLDPGLILSLSPALNAATKAVLTTWGKGKYDAHWNHDNMNGPVVIPPAYGLAGVSPETYTAEGSIPYWNAYVAITQMHGHGTFVDPRTSDDIHWTTDLVTSKLPDLQRYELSLTTPAPPAGSFDAAAATRGRALFEGKGTCASCHVPPLYTDAGYVLHPAIETCMDPVLATRGTTGSYRSTPLRALWQHPPYFHDGSASDLAAVVTHYDTCLTLGLTAPEQADLVEFLKSL